MQHIGTQLTIWVVIKRAPLDLSSNVQEYTEGRETQLVTVEKDAIADRSKKKTKQNGDRRMKKETAKNGSRLDHLIVCKGSGS